MYPMLKEGVSIGSFQYEGSDEIHYYVENREGEEFEISHGLYRALLHADGTQPLKARGCGKNTIKNLKRCGIVRTSRFVGDGLINRFIVCPIGSRAKKYYLACNMMNDMLPTASVLLFIIGVIMKLFTGEPDDYEFYSAIYYGFIILSLAAHEVGHLISGISSHYKFSDAGILLLGIFPIGAYVAHEENEHASQKEKLQLSLAGIEVNLLMAGIFLLASSIGSSMAYTYASVANVNLILAILNLLPAGGLDGETALSALIGVESISEIAKECISNKRQRRQLLRSGAKGYACICLLGFTRISDFVVWGLFAVDVVCTFISIF